TLANKAESTLILIINYLVWQGGIKRNILTHKWVNVIFDTFNNYIDRILKLISYFANIIKVSNLDIIHICSRINDKPTRIYEMPILVFSYITVRKCRSF